MTTFKTLFSVCFFSILSFILTAQQSAEELHVLLESCYNATQQEVYSNLKSIEKYPYSIFDGQAKRKVKQIISQSPPYLNRWIKLAGFLQMENELLAIAKDDHPSGIAERLNQSKSLKTSYNLALVRAGNKAKLKTLMKNVKKLDLNDNFVYEAVPQLIYARQKPIFDYLLEMIKDKRQNCTPADAETRGNISCAYRIIEEVAPYISDFPFEATSYGIKTDDYPLMLKQTRAWIRKNKNSYVLDKENY